MRKADIEAERSQAERPTDRLSAAGRRSRSLACGAQSVTPPGDWLA